MSSDHKINSNKIFLLCYRVDTQTHSRTMMRIISGPLKKNTSFITGEFGSLVTAHPAQLMIIH